VSQLSTVKSAGMNRSMLVTVTLSIQGVHSEHAPGVCQLSSFLPRESRYNKSKMLCGLYHNLPKKLAVCVSSVLSNAPVLFTYERLCTDTDQAHWFVAHEGSYAHVCAFFGSKETLAVR